MELAVDTLIAMLQDKECSRSIKVNAAKAIIDNGFKLREQDNIIERLKLIEQKFNENAEG